MLLCFGLLSNVEFGVATDSTEQVFFFKFSSNSYCFASPPGGKPSRNTATHLGVYRYAFNSGTNIKYNTCLSVCDNCVVLLRWTEHWQLAPFWKAWGYSRGDDNKNHSLEHFEQGLLTDVYCYKFLFSCLMRKSHHCFRASHQYTMVHTVVAYHNHEIACQLWVEAYSAKPIFHCCIALKPMFNITQPWHDFNIS